MSRHLARSKDCDARHPRLSPSSERRAASRGGCSHGGFDATSSPFCRWRARWCSRRRPSLPIRRCAKLTGYETPQFPPPLQVRSGPRSTRTTRSTTSSRMREPRGRRDAVAHSFQPSGHQRRHCRVAVSGLTYRTGRYAELRRCPLAVPPGRSRRRASSDRRSGHRAKWDELIAAIRDGSTYVNVHSTLHACRRDSRRSAVAFPALECVGGDEWPGEPLQSPPFCARSLLADRAISETGRPASRASAASRPRERSRRRSRARARVRGVRGATPLGLILPDPASLKWACLIDFRGRRCCASAVTDAGGAAL